MTAPVKDDVPVDTRATGARTRRRQEAHRNERRRWILFAVAVGGLAIAIPVLGWMGYRTLLDSHGGRIVPTTTVPTGELNQEMPVVPTPVALLVSGDGDRFAGVTLLVVGEGDEGGAVVFVPTQTALQPPNLFGISDLSEAFERSSPDGIAGFVANLLGVGLEERLFVDAQLWTQLVAPVSPLPIDNPSAVTLPRSDGTASELAPGPVLLDAADVFSYLEARRAGESPAAQATRHQAFWEAWLGAVAKSPDPAVVPGEGSSGVSRFVRALARGDVEYDLLPGAEVAGSGRYRPATEAIERLVTDIVAYPTGAHPGTRLRIRLLDGSGQPEARDLVGHRLVTAGAQLSVVGTADRFDYDDTEVRYGFGVDPAAAEDLRNAIGAGDVAPADTSTDAYDVTVIVGRDVADDLEP